MMAFERWAVIDAEGKEAERRAEIERRAREDREEELARQAYVQHALGERLLADVNDWELAGRLRSYIEEMASRIQRIADADDRAVAVAWMAWCEEYAARRDPFAKPIRQPNINPPGYSELQEFKRRLGFTAAYW